MVADEKILFREIFKRALLPSFTLRVKDLWSRDIKAVLESAENKADDWYFVTGRVANTD